MSLLPLSLLAFGETAEIVRLEGATEAMLPLLELGLAAGERVRLIRTAPLWGPLEVEVMGYRLALRRTEAARILVRRDRAA